MPGDLLLLPTGIPHRLSFAPDARCRPFDRDMKEQLLTADGDLILDGPGAATRFVCAGYDYDRDVAQSLLSLLPPVIHLPADPAAGGRIASILSLLAGELGARDAGARAAVARLIDLLLIHAVRTWGAGAPGPSWLRALHDPLVADVLAVLHQRPRSRGRVERLAAEVHLSRATLARRFTEHVGEPPLSVSDALADGAGRAPAQGHDRAGGGHRPRRRLHVGVRVQPGVQPPPRAAARTLPPRRAASRLTVMPAARMTALMTKYETLMSSAFSACTTTVWTGKMTAHRAR